MGRYIRFGMTGTPEEIGHVYSSGDVLEEDARIRPVLSHINRMLAQSPRGFNEVSGVIDDFMSKMGIREYSIEAPEARSFTMCLH
jgi:hypothetical protein